MALRLRLDGKSILPRPPGRGRQYCGPTRRLSCDSRRIFPFIQQVFADGGYAGEKVAKCG